MSRRILNVETMRADGPGYVLDVYESGASAFRAEVRDPWERIIWTAAGAKLDGDAGLLESLRTFFVAGTHPGIGRELVEGARLELELRGHDATPEEVSGMQIAGLVMEVLSPLRDAWPDIGVDALAEIAAKAAVEIHRRFDVKEKT